MHRDTAGGLRIASDLAATALVAILATVGYVHYRDGLGEALPIGFFYLAVILASLLDGLRGGAVALAASAIAMWLWPGLSAHLGALGMLFYLLSAGGLVWLVAAARRLRRVAQQEQANFLAMLDGVADGVVAIDDQRRIRYINSAAERLLELSRDQARGQSIERVLRAIVAGAIDELELELAPGSRLRIEKAGSDGDMLSLEVALMHDGPYAGSGQVLFLRADGPDRYALSDRRLRAVFDTEMWGICFVDQANDRWLANPGFRRLLPAMPAAPESSTLALAELGIPVRLLDRLRMESGFDPTEVHGSARGDHDWMLLAGQALGGDDVALLALDISERKRIDADLRAQRLLMRSLIDRLPALVAYVDVSRRYRLFNRRYARRFPGVALLDSAIDSVHTAAGLAPYLSLLDRAFTGESVRFPVEWRRRGARHHFDVQLIAHRPDGDTVEGVVIHAVDVTERVEAELRLHASERRFRCLGLAWAGIVWYADRYGNMTSAPGWEELTGQTALEYRNVGWQQAVDPRDRERVRAAWIDTVRATPLKMVELEFRVLTLHGESRHVSMRVVPVEIAEGQVIEWIGGIRDIHEQRLFEIQLRNAEAEQHALLDNLPKMVWIAEPDGSIRYQNRHWYEYTGLSGEENWQRITHPEDLNAGVRAWELAIGSGRPLNVELRFRGSDGEYRWHVVRGQPLFDQQGRVRCWYGASTDIEDQKRAQQTLAEANQRISHFLAVLSHELRNPLSGMSAAGALLAHDDIEPARREQALATLDRQSRHLQRMVEDLLEISRVTQGNLELRRETVELGQLLTEVRSDNLARADAAAVVIDPVRCGWGFHVDGDHARLRQVFDNLVSNAIKASAPGQRIDLHCRRDGEWIQVEVRDQGQGLSREIAGRLFEPFTQTPDWHSRGLGLGLNIVKTLVERHGGTVAASSAGLGRGSCFSVRLPALASAQVASSLRGEPIAPGTRRGRILIVDDERDTAEALQILLGFEGHEVHTAEDAASALDICREMRFDVVLCDLELPGPLDGCDVARALRAPIAPYLIAYSGYGQAEDRARTRQAGFDEHLVKPASLEELLAGVQRGLDKPSRRG